MIRTFSPKTLAEQIRRGEVNYDATTPVNLDKKVFTAYLESTAIDRVVEGQLPVIWIGDMDGRRRFFLKQSPACVNRGVAQAFQYWKVILDRFGDFYIVEKAYVFRDCVSIDVPLETLVLIKNLSCPKCGAEYPVKVGANQGVCSTCGTVTPLMYDKNNL